MHNSDIPAKPVSVAASNRCVDMEIVGKHEELEEAVSSLSQIEEPSLRSISRIVGLPEHHPRILLRRTVEPNENYLLPHSGL